MRSNVWLRRLYARLPLAWRESASNLLTAPLRRRVAFPRSSSWSLPQKEHAAASARTDYGPGAGVNIFGYFRGQFGLGESARLYTDALIAHGYPVALHDVDLAIPHGMEDSTLNDRLGTEMPYDVHLIFVNPDYFQAAIDKIGRARIAKGYVIACWFWELENIPEAWMGALRDVDEVIVSSEFVECMFRRVTDKPVTRVPLPLREIATSRLTRADFGIEESDFLFLLTFDFNSWLERKNPFAAIRAFKSAFLPERRNVKLLVKSSNGHRQPRLLLDLLSATDSDDRIIVRDQVIDRSHVRSLQNCADAYVSLHRAEGFGLGMAESMMLGKPVVATAWSGNTEFMDESNSCLVKYELVPVPPGAYQHWENQRWADADIEDAARQMRRLVDDPGFARRIGLKAAIDVRGKLSPAIASQLLMKRFDVGKSVIARVQKNHGMDLASRTH